MKLIFPHYYFTIDLKLFCPRKVRIFQRFAGFAEAFRNAIEKGLNNWFTEYSDQAGVSKRVELINKIISELPNLGTGQLELVYTHIEWIKAQAESNKRKREADKTIKTYQEYKNGAEIYGSKENC